MEIDNSMTKSIDKSSHWCVNIGKNCKSPKGLCFAYFKAKQTLYALIYNLTLTQIIIQ